MTIPIRNHLLDIIKQKENYTDKELEKALTKDGTVITEGEFIPKGILTNTASNLERPVYKSAMLVYM